MLQQLDNRELIDAWMSRALAGDFVAMAYVAIIRCRASSSPLMDYEANNWLRKAMASDNPEFLIDLGEELVIGTALKRDLNVAKDCFIRATALSKLMGSYAMARFTIGVNRDQGIFYLEQAASLGHIPSRHQLNALQFRPRGVARRILSFIFFPNLLKEIWRVKTNNYVSEHWWRYKDVFVDLNDEIPKLGDDRSRYFPWSRPSTIAAFAACVIGKSCAMHQGAIDLRP